MNYYFNGGKTEFMHVNPPLFTFSKLLVAFKLSTWLKTQCHIHKLTPQFQREMRNKEQFLMKNSGKERNQSCNLCNHPHQFDKLELVFGYNKWHHFSSLPPQPMSNVREVIPHLVSEGVFSNNRWNQKEIYNHVLE